MGDTLSGALDDARRLGFVGRATELAAFVAALDGSAPARVLFVHGPGGIGKSTLLDEMRRRAVARGRPVVSLDGRDVAGLDPRGRGGRRDGGRRSRPGVARRLLRAAHPARPLVPAANCCRRCPRGRSPCWPDGSRRARRGRPTRAGDGSCAAASSPRWKPPRARTWWAGSAPPSAACARLAELGRGHPLALVLLAEAAAQGRAPGRLDDLPDLVAALCHVLVRDVPDAAHRIGLATCAHAYRTTEDLLAETVGERAPEVWTWLASRPFVRHSGRACTCTT